MLRFICPILAVCVAGCVSPTRRPLSSQNPARNHDRPTPHVSVYESDRLLTPSEWMQTQADAETYSGDITRREHDMLDERYFRYVEIKLRLLELEERREYRRAFSARDDDR